MTSFVCQTLAVNNMEVTMDYEAEVPMCICGRVMGFFGETCDVCEGEPSEKEDEPCGGCGACREGVDGCSNPQ